MRVVAYWHGPERIYKYAQAFANGCPFPCNVWHVNKSKQHQYDVVWLYGLGDARQAFDHHSNALRLVGDKGYFHGLVAQKYLRVSVNAQQPDAHLRRREHSPERFDALGIAVQPVTRRGEYILLCGNGPKQAGLQGTAYGEWERQTYERLKAITGREILAREKPKNPPIEGLPRSTHASTADAIRGAWAVVSRTGNIGADAILHGVPVIAEAGPGAVYYNAPLADIETIQPISADERRNALADIAAWNWRRDELNSGAFWRHLEAEGLV